MGNILSGLNRIPRHGRIFTMMLLMALSLLFTFLVEFGLQTSIIYTHFYYLPLITAAFWYDRKALLLALALGLLHIMVTWVSNSHPLSASFFRAAIFSLVTIWSAELSRGYRAGEEARREAEYRETLMRELQHRVKNNLNIISSLISMETSNTSDEMARRVLTSSQDRIRSISGIYQKLSLSRDMETIELHRYIQELASALISTYCIPTGRIRLETSLQEVTMDTRRAVPIGLILNELITNSVKYAYPEPSDGVLRLEMTNSAQTLTVRVIDHGHPQTSPENQGIGLNLVRMLTEQLNGQMVIEQSGGTTATLTMKL